MGTSRGSSRSRLVVDNTVWANEAVGEEAVLAEFADETALSQAGPVPASLQEPAERPYRGLRLLSPPTSLKELVRTVLVGCMSAMALGASFAIGFGYVWSDRPAIAPSTQTTSTTDAPPAGELSLPSSQPSSSANPARSSASDAATTVPSVVAPAQTPPAMTPTPLDIPPATPQALSAVADPGPAFGVAMQATVVRHAPSAEDAASEVRVPTEDVILASQPMLTADSAPIAESVSPSSPNLRVTPSAARANESSESTAATVRRAELDAVHQAIERYQVAYSQKDVGAMALVWPSVDVAGVARAFENVDRQALTFTDCRVTTAGDLATAVCPGQVRYIGRVGGRQMQERNGTWTIALERRGDAWQFTRLNVR